MEARDYASLRAKILLAIGPAEGAPTLVHTKSSDEASAAHASNPGEGRLLRGCSGDVLAPAVSERGDWCAFAVGKYTGSPEEGRRLGDYWSRVACMEHASISSFSKASLELVQLGAPSTLLRDTHRAALDEVRHAELAFALASEFAGTLLGPAAHPLPLTLESSPVSIFRATFFDGCVQEAIGAALMRFGAQNTSDRRIRAVFESLADDEERHVEVAFRALSWLRRTFEECAALSPDELLTEARAMAPPEATPYVTALDAQKIATDIFLEVIEPCVVALLSSFFSDVVPSSSDLALFRARVAQA